jgi:hypothetical protein
MSWDKAVSIVTGCGSDDRDSISSKCRNFSLHYYYIQTSYGVPSCLSANGYWEGCFPVIKWLVCQTNHSFLTNAEVLCITFVQASCLWWGHAVAQLVEALLYKPERRGFDSDGVT